MSKHTFAEAIFGGIKVDNCLLMINDILVEKSFECFIRLREHISLDERRVVGETCLSGRGSAGGTAREIGPQLARVGSRASTCTGTSTD